jgi:hypothetical protein
VGKSEGKRAFIIVIVEVVIAITVMGGLMIYFPGIRPYAFIIYLAILIAGGIGAFLALNVWSGNPIKKVEEY